MHSTICKHARSAWTPCVSYSDNSCRYFFQYSKYVNSLHLFDTSILVYEYKV